MTHDFDMVIFGGLGDLSLRKLLPALYRSEVAGHLPRNGRIFLISRALGEREEELTRIQEWLTNQLKSGESPTSHWPEFEQRLHLCAFDVTEDGEGWADLEQPLLEVDAAEGKRDRVFYLAMPPSLYGTICEQLSGRGLINETSRVVLEKPLGYDRTTANEINAQVAKYFPENSIFRIDHYLGKETVQNLLALRFANIMFEPLWNGNYIDHVQISLSEEVGLEGRTAFYDQAGAMRDMIQNHLLQLLCLVAMEPPHKLQADNIRTEKLKVLQALRPLQGYEVQSHTVRGQYVDGMMHGKAVPGYLDELGKDSQTETFVAIKAHIDNWRWSGVPFYFRTGKRLRQRCAEIVIQFKSLTHNVFDGASTQLSANRLVIRLQPDEGIEMTVMAKELNQLDMRLQEVPLNLNFAETFQNIHSDSYQRLLLNVIDNDLSLFAHRDEADLAWAWVDPIINAWNKCGTPVQAYEAGSWGPDASAALLHSDKRAWHNNGGSKRGKR
ncbi:glucose-6-phosphate dehydrogenase [Aestuariicella hydrocarbonica]|uniref:Glucose-6-phosphate 1-dehydrogenase n=1 Tax=Pseudomaricurvus hydrocarbonicus TaxID=1470433 RepID=A0A9E5JT92_9GAMM|nr:glucose-6-phosphate dehydrogenase [Aestuariicella hydrocarbonica]NHO66393.1 glucose-6-phosphate dehydrogenase [Aestuariicella hydrocarbonica]